MSETIRPSHQELWPSQISRLIFFYHRHLLFSIVNSLARSYNLAYSMNRLIMPFEYGKSKTGCVEGMGRIMNFDTLAIVYIGFLLFFPSSLPFFI
jgi:hypothetical protein